MSDDIQIQVLDGSELIPSNIPIQFNHVLELLGGTGNFIYYSEANANFSIQTARWENGVPVIMYTKVSKTKVETIGYQGDSSTVAEVKEKRTEYVLQGIPEYLSDGYVLGLITEDESDSEKLTDEEIINLLQEIVNLRLRKNAENNGIIDGTLAEPKLLQES